MPIRLEAIVPKKYALIDPKLTVKEMKAGLKEYLELVASIMEKYPPPWSRYRRTYKLRRGWKSRSAIKIASDGSEGTLINPVKYAARVQGPKEGATDRQDPKFSRHGWKSITTVARETRRQYSQIMNRRIRGTYK